jgi:hypothetical protein
MSLFAVSQAADKIATVEQYAVRAFLQMLLDAIPIALLALRNCPRRIHS